MPRLTEISLQEEQAYIHGISSKLGITEEKFWEDFNNGLEQSTKDLKGRLIGAGVPNKIQTYEEQHPIRALYREIRNWFYQRKEYCLF